MGLEFRKSKNITKNTRISASNSSVGISTGVKGFRIGINSKGSSSINLSIPGTGLRYRKVFGKKDSGVGIAMFIVMGFMNIMIYIMQAMFVMIWWLLKLFVWIFYYYLLLMWKGCKFIYTSIKNRINRRKEEKKDE